MTGRKRHLVVDTLGLLLAVVVHAANVQDRDGARLVLAKLAGRFPRLWLLWADGGYAGALLVWALVAAGLVIEVVAKPAGTTTFTVLPKRWIVERTFGWLGRCRRLAKDFENLARSHLAFVQLAMIRLMMRRIARLRAAP